MLKLIVVSLAIMLLASSIIHGGNAATLVDCGGACKVRCGSSSRLNLCERACGTCCARCNCIPPDTNGNYNMCPCYATMTTRDGARKCP